MALGSVYAWAVFSKIMARPVRAGRGVPVGRVSTRWTLASRLGLAAAIAAAVGFWLNLDHV